MKGKILFATLASFAVTASAEAALISGFDASQFFSSGGTVTDASFSNVGSFPAQFSEFDTNHDAVVGAGPDSAAFGGSWWDGTNGSDNTRLGLTSFAAGTFTGGSINLLGSSSLITTDFSLQMSQPGTAAALVADGGQTYGNPLGYIAADTVSVVFSGDVSSIGSIADNWVLNLGALNGDGGQIDVEFSTDGSSYAPVGDPFELSPVETEFTSVSVSAPSAEGFFRITLPTGTTVDNIAVLGDVSVVPEPSTAVLMLTGLAGLARASRRREN